MRRTFRASVAHTAVPRETAPGPYGRDADPFPGSPNPRKVLPGSQEHERNPKVTDCAYLLTPHQSNLDGRDVPHGVLIPHAGSQLRDLLQRGGYRVDECLLEHIPFEQLDANVTAILITAAPARLRGTFKIVHQANEWRFSRSSLAPELIVVVAPQLSASTIADLREQFCRVIYEPRVQLLPELKAIAVERERLLARGVLLLFFRVPGSFPRVFLSGPDGRQDELNLNIRQMRLLLRLSSAPRTFGQDELALAVGCPSAQVRVYIERLRTEYEMRRRNIGILLSSEEFIRNPGHGCGWRLHARIKNIELAC